MSAADAVGTQCGPYRLISRLGKGGAGVVYLALDESGTAAAVKLFTGPVSHGFRQDISAEVIALRRVRHPGVAQLLAADLAADPAYLATTFVPGRTVADQVSTHGPWSASKVAQMGAQLAAALRAIHTVGVVHGDVKPSNVVVRDTTPMLIDFGVASLLDQTHAPNFLGSPGYVAPEVASLGRRTAESDWWGWAATLAFAATGRPPFAGASAADMVVAGLTGAADLDGIDARLAAVLRRAFTLEPAGRPDAGLLISTWRTQRPDVEPAEEAATLTAPLSLLIGPIPVKNEVKADGGDDDDVEDGLDLAGARKTTLTHPEASVPGPAGAKQAAGGHTGSTLDLHLELSATQPLPHSTDRSATLTRPLLPRGIYRTISRMALLTLLVMGVFSAATFPGFAMLVMVVWVVCARTAGASVAEFQRRRLLAGPVRFDAAWAWLRSPLHLVQELPAVVLVLVVAGLAARGAGWLTIQGLVVLADKPGVGPIVQRAGLPISLVVSMAVATVLVWRGSGSHVQRLGTYLTLGVLASRTGVRRVLITALGVLMLVVVVRLLRNTTPDWHPWAWPHVSFSWLVPHVTWSPADWPWRR